jgi:hypothetical protein
MVDEQFPSVRPLGSGWQDGFVKDRPVIPIHFVNKGVAFRWSLEKVIACVSNDFTRLSYSRAYNRGTTNRTDS